MTYERIQSEETIVIQKKEYSAPKLTNYGGVSQLTMGADFQGNDGNTKCTNGNAGDAKSCS